jgi:hypothetical protein
LTAPPVRASKSQHLIRIISIIAISSATSSHVCIVA